jgi:transposase
MSVCPTSAVSVTTAPPDADGLRELVRRAATYGGPVHAVIESMTGARFVHDTLELHGWEVDIADAQKVKGLAPLACKIDAWVLARLSRRDLVPAIWLPDPAVRGERERARFRLHMVRHRVMLKNRVHASLMSFGKPCSVSDLFGYSGREMLARLDLLEPWTENITTALRLIDTSTRRSKASSANYGLSEPTIPTSRCSSLCRVWPTDFSRAPAISHLIPNDLGYLVNTRLFSIYW